MYVIWSFFVIIIIKLPSLLSLDRHYHIGIFSAIRAKRRFSRPKKEVQVARNEERGGEVIWAMPERKHFFSGWLPLFDIAHL